MFGNHKIKVALTREKLLVLTQSSNESDIIKLIRQDTSFFEQISIMSEGLVRGEKQFSFEYENENGKYYLIKAYYAEELFEYKYPCLNLFVTDITQYKRELLETKRQNIEYQQIANTISNGVILIDPEKEYQIHWASQQFYEMVGHSEFSFHQKFGISILGCIMKEDQEKCIQLLNMCVEGEKLCTETLRIVDSTEQVHWVTVHCGREKTKKNNSHIFCVFTDMTEEIIRNQELKSFQQRYKMVLSITSEVLFEYDVKAETMYYFGGDKNRLKRPARIESFSDSIRKKGINGGHLTKESEEKLLHLFHLLVERKEEIVDTYLCYYFPDGKVQWTYIVGKVILNSNQEVEVVIGKISDMTSHKEEEKNYCLKRVQIL